MATRYDPNPYPNVNHYLDTQLRSKGEIWELRALRFLTSRGLRLVERNYAAKVGELDLIMLDGDTVVFVEVRQRKQSRFSSAAESVDKCKQKRLRLAATRFIQSHPALAHQPCRFDIVAWDTSAGTVPAPSWLRGALLGF